MASNNSNIQVAELKSSFFSMASTAYSSSKTAFTRARQFTEERIGNVEKTEYDAQFEALSQRADSTKLWTEKVMKATEGLIEPNPGARVEGLVYEKLDKKVPTRPTNAYTLGTTMAEAGQNFGPGTAYGGSLMKTGAALKKIGNAEKDFAQKATSHFHYPLKTFLENDMKTIAKERRSLSTARLDLDACKNKVKKAQTPEKMKQAEAELRVAQAEFDRQYEITRLLLDGVSATQGNHLASLNSFVEALGMYHAQAQQCVAELQKQLQS